MRHRAGPADYPLVLELEYQRDVALARAVIDLHYRHLYSGFDFALTQWRKNEDAKRNQGKNAHDGQPFHKAISS